MADRHSEQAEEVRDPERLKYNLFRLRRRQDPGVQLETAEWRVGIRQDLLVERSLDLRGHRLKHAFGHWLFAVWKAKGLWRQGKQTERLPRVIELLERNHGTNAVEDFLLSVKRLLAKQDGCQPGVPVQQLQAEHRDREPRLHRLRVLPWLPHLRNQSIELFRVKRYLCPLNW